MSKTKLSLSCIVVVEYMLDAFSIPLFRKDKNSEISFPKTNAILVNCSMLNRVFPNRSFDNVDAFMPVKLASSF